MAKFNLNRVPPYLKNKYAVIAIPFFIWMLFFDKNDMISQIQLRRQLSALKQEKAYYESKILEVEVTAKDLRDPARLEQFAREEYLMKKENEDLFVIVEEPGK